MATIVRMAPGWQAKVDRATFPHLVRVAAAVARDVRQNIIVGRHIETGRMLLSVHHRGTTVHIGTDHWVFPEYGVARHPIRTRLKRTLTDRRQVFGTAVDHPGNPPYAMVRRAVFKRRNLARP